MLKTLSRTRRIIFIVFCHLYLFASADEGMWIPSLLEHYHIDVMQEKGLRLSADDIYNINQASLKDGVVIFGGGCTGGVISQNGLIITNHHCGFGSIQSLSTLETDYLSNGFWAMTKEEELPAPGISAVFLIRIEDVTSLVMEGIEMNIPESQRKDKLNSNIRRVSGNAVEGTHYSATIKSFYYGNEYYMFIYEEFTDVRLVGAPPSTVGNFGSDPDNWVWPRHTGDFSIFRIYAGEDNKPARYSSGNKPYLSRKVLPITTAGYIEDDFTMLLGYPGTTTQYLIAPGIELIYKDNLTHKIKLRDKRMQIMDSYMEDSDRIRLQYASKYRNVSNSWKKWKGVVSGLNRVDGVSVKKQQEETFLEWVNAEESRKAEYGTLIPGMYKLYDELRKYDLVYDYAQECVMATEIFSLFFRLSGLITENRESSDHRKIRARERFLNEADGFFKDYHKPLDIQVFSAMLRYFYEDINIKFHPEFYKEIHTRYKGDYEQFAQSIFKESKLVSYEKISDLFSSYPENEKKLRNDLLKDPLYTVFSSFIRMYRNEVYANYEFIYDEIDRHYRLYVKGLREMEPDRAFYPDANFTMRLTYGKIESYSPVDAITYHYKTSIDGKIEKYEMGIPDYDIPEKLLELYNNQDYGRWADKEGNLYTCFIASNHTSGGNSGSPVMNGSGQIIGINFDRNWEGTMNDYIYDPLQCRNISVDIRYILFIIDKFAGAGHLIEEMELVN